MTVRKIIQDRDPGNILTCETRVAVRDAIALLAGKRIGALPIVEDGAVVGIFSERDVIYRLASEGAMCLDRPVAEVMTSPAITVRPQDTIDDAFALMTKRRIRHLPVIENGALAGFVSIGDLVKYRIDAIESERESLRTYIQTA